MARQLGLHLLPARIAHFQYQVQASETQKKIEKQSYDKTNF
jgi:hypothetical protein